MKTSNPIDTFFSYIENKDEDAAIHYLAEQGKNFNVNCVKHGCLAIIYAVEKGMMRLFDAIVKHPTFDTNVHDCLLETPMISFISRYCNISELEESWTKVYEKEFYSIATSLMSHPTFDPNNDNRYSKETALDLACNYPNLSRLVEMLVKNRNVNVNHVNTFNNTPLLNCLVSENTRALAALGRRPDLVVKDSDRKIANEHGIKLEDYIKPSEDVYDDNWLGAINSAEVSVAASVAY